MNPTRTRFSIAVLILGLLISFREPLAPGCLRHPLPGATLSQGFSATHPAWDLAAPLGTQVRAGSEGTVVEVQSGMAEGAYGPGTILKSYHAVPDAYRFLPNDPTLPSLGAHTLGELYDLIDQGILVSPTPKTIHGNYVILRSGPWLIQYSHLHSVAVARGQLIQGGALVGEVGSTGRSLAPHLHFAVWDEASGAPVDPLALICL